MPAARPTALTPAVPGGNAPTVGGRAQLGTSPALPGKEVRALVASAIEQRKRLLRNGKGHIRAGALYQPIGFLEAWLSRTNEHVGQGSLRDFWRMHENDIRLVMPGTLGGGRTLARIKHLCA